MRSVSSDGRLQDAASVYMRLRLRRQMLIFKTAHVSRWPGYFCLSALLILVCVGAAMAQTTSFTYQGRLTDGGTPANGTYEIQFTLWDAVTGGTQQPRPAPVTITRANVQVSAGAFTVQPLDFGAIAFPGADRYLEISVRRMPLILLRRSRHVSKSPRRPTPCALCQPRKPMSLWIQTSSAAWMPANTPRQRVSEILSSKIRRHSKRARI